MKEKPCIRIGHLKIVDHLILGLAGLGLKTGKFHLDHCSLDPIVMHSWEQIREALISKQINAAFITAPLAMDLFTSGLDIRLLMFTHRSGSTIVKKAGANIKTIADFKGKTVLVPSELSIQHMLLHRLLSTVSLKLGAHDDPSADVFYEATQPFLMSDLLANDTDNDIAGFVMAEPYGSQAVLDGVAQKLCASKDLWNNHPCCSFVVHASVLENNTAAVKEIIHLFLHIAKELEPPDTGDILLDAQKFLCQKTQVVEEVLLNQPICFNPSLLIPDINALTTIANYMKNSMNFLTDKVDMGKFVDNTFILSSTKMAQLK